MNSPLLLLSTLLAFALAPAWAILRANASELNRQGIRARRGGHWHVSNVRNLLDRIGRLTEPG